jgi:DNA-binding transcriptional MerR regulator
MDLVLPVIPAKRYFTIGEVGDLCGVKPHVLRYWEQEFTQLRPMKRRGNRRYYQHHEVLMIRRIRDLLYDQGFTISGARNKMQEMLHSSREQKNENSLEFIDDVNATSFDLEDPALHESFTVDVYSTLLTVCFLSSNNSLKFVAC